MGCPLTDAEALNYVSKSNNDDPEVIVVYGSAIKCLTAVSRLLKAGISFGRIVAVVKDAPGCIDDVVDPAVSWVCIHFVAIFLISCTIDYCKGDGGYRYFTYHCYVGSRNRGCKYWQKWFD